MYHSSDFSVSADWNFFATSHGKSPCDGIGGTVKREAARASLQATVTSYILTPADLFSRAEKNISGVKLIWISQESVKSMADKLESRFAKSITVPGTRDNHCFKPVSATKLEVSRVSGIPGFCVNYEVEEEVSEGFQISDMTPGKYTTCVYDGHWGVGSIRDTSEAQQDVLIQFMHPHGPAKRFFWPRREDL